MVVWIPAGRSNRCEMPEQVMRVVDRLAPLASFDLRDAKGGITRQEVVTQVVDLIAADAPMAATYMDGRAPGGVAVRVEAGRAHTNNEGVWAALTAAIDSTVSSLVLVVPETYKGGRAAEPMEARLIELLGSAGVMFDLTGVAVVRY